MLAFTIKKKLSVKIVIGHKMRLPNSILFQSLYYNIEERLTEKRRRYNQQQQQKKLYCKVKTRKTNRLYVDFLTIYFITLLLYSLYQSKLAFNL